MDPAEVAVLMSSGQDSLKAGDIEAARIGVRAGWQTPVLPPQHWALASTYDPATSRNTMSSGVRRRRKQRRAPCIKRRDGMGSAEAGRHIGQRGRQK